MNASSRRPFNGWVWEIEEMIGTLALFLMVMSACLFNWLWCALGFSVVTLIVVRRASREPEGGRDDKGGLENGSGKCP